MRYKRFKIAKTTTVHGRIDIHQVTIEIEEHIPHDATYNDLVSDSSPEKGKILVLSADNKKRIGYIREDSIWFNYDVISDSIMGNYYMMGKRAPAGLGANSMFGAIKRFFCEAIMNIEIER
jgi:hypothetical protein